MVIVDCRIGKQFDFWSHSERLPPFLLVFYFLIVSLNDQLILFVLYYTWEIGRNCKENRFRSVTCMIQYYIGDISTRCRWGHWLILWWFHRLIKECLLLWIFSYTYSLWRSTQIYINYLILSNRRLHQHIATDFRDFIQLKSTSIIWLD